MTFKVVVMDVDLYNRFAALVIDKHVVCVSDGVGVAVGEKSYKRGPTEYNKFIGTTLRKIAEDYPDMPRKDRMILAQKLYREKRNMA